MTEQSESYPTDHSSISNQQIGAILDEISRKEQRARRRAVLYTAVPIVVAAIIFMVVANYVAESRKQLNDLQQQITDLKKKEAVLNEHVQESAAQFIEIARITQQVERLIESKQSYLRTLDEARYLIDLRMKFDSLNSELQQLSQNIPEIKNITDQRRWITIVKSSRDLDSLRLSALPWIAKYGRDKVAIYKTRNGFYALAVLTDGSFTKAYRLTVDLMKTGDARDAYFDDSTDWGPNLL